jgi:hypothetical protein
VALPKGLAICPPIKLEVRAFIRDAWAIADILRNIKWTNNLHLANSKKPNQKKSAPRTKNSPGTIL